MKKIAEAHFNPIYFSKGDSIELRESTSGVVLKKTIDKKYVFTKGIVFEIEKTDEFFGGNIGLGGAFIEEIGLKK